MTGQPSGSREFANNYRPHLVRSAAQTPVRRVRCWYAAPCELEFFFLTAGAFLCTVSLRCNFLLPWFCSTSRVRQSKIPGKVQWNFSYASKYFSLWVYMDMYRGLWVRTKWISGFWLAEHSGKMRIYISPMKIVYTWIETCDAKHIRTLEKKNGSRRAKMDYFIFWTSANE